MRATPLDLGIFLVSFAVLLTELLLTRIFSVTMYYHLSFMVVSLAMLGFAASGLFVTLRPRRFPRERLFSHTALAALAFALSTVAAVGVSFWLPISLASTAPNWARVAAVYVACAVPFFCGGLVVSLILSHRAEQANRYYFFDLVGAALGCLAIIPATNRLGAPNAVLAAAATAAVAAAVLAGRSRLRTAALLVAGGLVAGAVANARLSFYDVQFAKGTRQPPMLVERWNAFSRVDVAGTPQGLWSFRPPSFAGFSARLDPEFTIAEAQLRYDADAATKITYFDGDLRRLAHLRFDVASAPYRLSTPRSALIIGPGGGRDVLMALALSPADITGVEINPITVQLMKTRFRTFSGGLYDGYPRVHVVNDEGRSFLRRQTARYDLIVASLVDTWAASTAGAYALTENSLYTTDAFGEYLDHLTPDGMICFTRWFSEPPVESMRVASLAVAALRSRGVADPAQHLMVVRTDPDQTLDRSLNAILVKRSPFSAAQVKALRDFATEMGFLVPYVPGGEGDGDFYRLLGPASPSFLASVPYDLSPVSDDRPFFFSRVPVLAWLGHRLGVVQSKYGQVQLGVGGGTLVLCLGVSLVFTVLLFWLPSFSGRVGGRGSGRTALWAVYFGGLGLGFILVELVLVQSFGLFLGYPIYSLSVVLFTMLLASGLGSLASARLRFGGPLARTLLALVAGLGLLALALPPVLAYARGAALPVRIALAVASIAPVAFAMGIPFPAGVRRVRGEAPGLVAWAWAVNGGSSVFGSALAVVVSMTFGFRAAFLLGALAYLVALAVVVALSRRVPEASS